MGYYFHDLDGGDVPELIIGWTRGCEESTIVDLYTCKDGTMYHLLSTGERWDYTLNKDNSIAVEPYGGSCQCRRLLRLSKGANEMTTEVMTEVFKSKAIAVGSPTVSNSILSSVAGWLEFLKQLKFKNKRAAAFGCYGWSGESVKLLQARLKEAGFAVIDESVRSL